MLLFSVPVNFLDGVGRSGAVASPSVSWVWVFTWIIITEQFFLAFSL